MSRDEKTAIVRVGDEREVTSAERFDASEVAERQAAVAPPRVEAQAADRVQSIPRIVSQSMPVSVRNTAGETTTIVYKISRAFRVEIIIVNDTRGGRGTEVEVLLPLSSSRGHQRIYNNLTMLNYICFSGEEIVVNVKFHSDCTFVCDILGREVVW